MEENPQEQVMELAPVIHADVLEAQERAQTDIAIATAKKYPRVLTDVKRRMMDLALLDGETAQSCFYELPRDGKTIEGASVRLAEIAVNAFGNIKAFGRVIGNDGKVITAQGVCHDLERNVQVGVEVKRRITNKYGKTFSEDMQVVTGNAAVAIALRNAIYKVIPQALIKPIYEAAKKAAAGDEKTLVQRRKNMLAVFGALGVEKERIFAVLGAKSEEDIGTEGLLTLIGIHNAVKDGETTLEQVFPPIENEKIPQDPKGKKKKEDPTITKPVPEDPASDIPKKKTPLDLLREKIDATPFKEAEFFAFIKKKGMTPAQDMESLILPEITKLLDTFESIVNQMADTHA